MKSGIYLITNILNDKKYVGSSKNLTKRKYSHFSTLQKNKHPNLHMQNSYNKYGSSAFLFQIIEQVADIDMLIEREQHWIDALKPVYNKRAIASSNQGSIFSEYARKNMSIAMTGTGNNFYGRIHTEETKLKMSALKKGKNWTELQRLARIDSGKTTYQFDLEGNFVREYVSLKQAAEINNFNYKWFGESINKKNRLFKGFYWVYKPEAIKEIIDFVK